MHPPEGMYWAGKPKSAQGKSVTITLAHLEDVISRIPDIEGLLWRIVHAIYPTHETWASVGFPGFDLEPPDPQTRVVGVTGRTVLCSNGREHIAYGSLLRDGIESGRRMSADAAVEFQVAYSELDDPDERAALRAELRAEHAEFEQNIRPMQAGIQGTSPAGSR